MKMSKWALFAALACGIPGVEARAQENMLGITRVSHLSGACDCGQVACGCESEEIGSEGGSCDSGCDSAAAAGLGDPWKLFADVEAIDIGGWTNIGFHNRRMKNFFAYPGKVQLHQQWLYAEKAIDTEDGFDIGGRVDYVYGTDGPDTQVFGTNRGWDSGWDNGSQYGHALPQAYFETGYGDLSVKVGHFFTLIGWEVVPAPNNFFYSHSYTMYNSEPFTHTGALAKYAAGESTTLWGGYVLGWDNGFDDNGDAFLGGISQGVGEDLTLTYATIMGRFAEARFTAVETGYMHSLIADYAVTDKLQYIIQNDILSSNLAGGATARDVYDINQYLIYSINDHWSLGSRFEWWSVARDSANYFAPPTTSGRVDVYAITAGVNYKPNANIIVRPEVRYDWASGPVDDGIQQLGLFKAGRDDQFTFGIDSIFLF